MRVAGKAVQQTALIVADVGVIEAGVTLEHGFATHVPLPRERHRQHRIAHCRAFAQGLAAAARALDIAAREARAQRDRAVHLVFVELQDFRRGNRAAEDTENRARMKTARRQRWDELRRQPLHHFVAGRDSGNVFLAGCARFLGCRQCRRRHAGARMH